MPQQPAGVVISANGAEVQLDFPSLVDPDVVGYVVYRSANVLSVGSPVATIPQPVGGGPVTWLDTTTAYGDTWFYRVVAGDMFGVSSLPSDAVFITLESTPYVHDLVLKNLVAVLKSDSTLMAMLLNAPQAVRVSHKISMVGDIFPFLVVTRKNWVEDKKWRQDVRHATLSYTLECWNNQPSVSKVTDILHRISQVVDGEPGKYQLSSNGVTVASSFFQGAGPELYDQALSLWGQTATLSLVVEFFPT